MLIDVNALLAFLAVFIGVCLGFGVLVLLIIALVNIIKTLRKVNKLLDNNGVSIDEAVKKLPQLIGSIDKTVISVGETSESVRDTFFDSSPPSDTVSSIAGIIEGVSSVVISFLSRRK
ncbi:hypothetical protein [Fusibacter sp. 3D3]|uniref:hypothetical protein n=1 Tax=Fusibacter sp. 3D3 TaxID=1048380 RepID=UPI0008534564|nr:hypothetical protein [Fusibacter sp. 3D3]GAU79188.1 hypothetical protein F3D3_3826 [Fusibacter sp. 3D3]